MIYAALFSPSNPNASYILFRSYISQYESTGEVYGDVMLEENLTVAAGQTLTVSEGARLTVPEGVTLTNNGRIVNNGAIKIEGGNGYTGECSLSGNTIEQDGIPYLDEQGQIQYLPKSEVTTLTDATTALEGGWYLVEGDVTLTKALSIPNNKSVDLILADGAHLTLKNGLDTPSYGASLAIWAQSTGEQMGRLTAEAGLSVGGNSDLLIHGGAIDASVSTGGGSAAVRGGNVTITGGVIAASSGQTSGIYATDKVAISGGSITATGSGGKRRQSAGKNLHYRRHGDCRGRERKLWRRRRHRRWTEQQADRQCHQRDLRRRGHRDRR